MKTNLSIKKIDYSCIKNGFSPRKEVCKSSFHSQDSFYTRQGRNNESFLKKKRLLLLLNYHKRSNKEC